MANRNDKQTMTAADWRATVDDLGVQINALAEEVEEIEAGRGPLALKAQLGDADARSLIESQDAELASIARQRLTLEQARTEAEREVQAAERREVEERRAKADREADELTARARDLAERLDASIEQCAADAMELERAMARAAALRGGNTAHTSTRVARAVRSAFWSQGLQVGDYVPPSWRAPVLEGLAGLLGVDEKERAA